MPCDVDRCGSDSFPCRCGGLTHGLDTAGRGEVFTERTGLAHIFTHLTMTRCFEISRYAGRGWEVIAEYGSESFLVVSLIL